ncbi:MAG: RNA polymerase sigma factor [Bacteroidales bacterium]|nr:RNA polymerase sigma factor [Bacteroidales bacterium]
MFFRRKKSHSEQSDEHLFIGLSNGDTESFDELYHRYHQRLLYYFYRMLGGDQEIAQDFLQELFYKIINKPHLYDSSRKFSTWVFSVAHNMCKNEYRSREIRKIVVKTENADCYTFEEDDDRDKQQLIDAVFSHLSDFDEIHRTAFLLKYREGLSIDEISDVLELPKGTIKSRLFYTRKKLQEKLEVQYQNTIDNVL